MQAKPIAYKKEKKEKRYRSCQKSFELRDEAVEFN